MTFGEFAVDPDAGILRRGGQRVKLQDLPFRLLVALLRRPGAVVTREELRSELWGAATFVDAEAGLNTAIAKIREALGDAAESPRFVETLPKRGYRFIGTVVPDNDAAPVAATAMTPSPSPPVAASAGAIDLRPSRRRWLGLAAILALAVLGFTAYPLFDFETTGRTSIAVVRFHNETGDPANDALAGSLTDAVVVSLAQNATYGVIGNSPLLRTDRLFADVTRIGASLHVDFVVLGQLQQADTGLVVRAHFIRTRDERHLWATTIDLAATAAREQRVTSAITGGVASGLGRR